MVISTMLTLKVGGMIVGGLLKVGAEALKDSDIGESISDFIDVDIDPEVIHDVIDTVATVAEYTGEMASRASGYL